jgi:hypothetical protein
LIYPFGVEGKACFIPDSGNGFILKGFQNGPDVTRMKK